MMTISNTPDYSSIKKLSEEVHMSIKEPVLPIKVKPLINVLIKKDLIVNTFNQYTDIATIDYNKFICSAPSKDGTLRYFPDTNSYILLYNKNVQRERKTWTIAHELGHYYANHHIKMLNYLKENETIPNELNTVLEQEANCFAREFLAPTCLIQIAMAVLNILDFVGIYTIVRSMFRLSQEASYYIATDMTKCRHPYCSERLYLKYKPAINDFFNIVTDYSSFHALLRKYQREIDSRDYWQRMIIKPIDFASYY